MNECQYVGCNSVIVAVIEVSRFHLILINFREFFFYFVHSKSDRRKAKYNA